MAQDNNLTKYEVTVTRTIEHVVTLEVEATCLADAKSIGLCAAAAPGTRWVECDMVDETVKARVSRG